MYIASDVHVPVILSLFIMNGLVCLKNRAEEQFLMNEKDLKGCAESADQVSAQPADASYCTRKHMHTLYIV